MSCEFTFFFVFVGFHATGQGRLGASLANLDKSSERKNPAQACCDRRKISSREFSLVFLMSIAGTPPPAPSPTARFPRVQSACSLSM